MMKYTKEEIVLCTYNARFGYQEIDFEEIGKLQERSIASIKMKIQNIAWMLNEKGYDHHSSVPRLSGMPAGKKGRLTNWDIVELLIGLNKDNFWNICKLCIK